MLGLGMDKRLPNGQRWIEDPIVYDIAHVERLEPTAARLRLSGLIETPIVLTWDQLMEMPCAKIVRDFHCVTSWSVQDVEWEGIRTQVLLDRLSPSPEVQWVLARGRDGYVTSVPYEAFARPDSLLAYRMNGKLLSLEHGQPVRLVIPSLYAWKSAKYLDQLDFVHALTRGFWEQRGYHDRGDPWREERFRT
jgi:DMSO/TMAO reductase YedYZ molybdopterin-dependent catalytic subunit